jgi:protein-L-isoaspartate(D-aspartate) O-methyltransferase
MRSTFAIAIALAAATCRGPQNEASSAGGPVEPNWEAQRARMVAQQMQARGVREPRLLDALRRVPRHLFVPPEVRHRAYTDEPLPIGAGQTISQPYIVAAMTELLAPQPGEKVLEVGTGSGYQAAVLAELGAHVYTIEIVPELAEMARRHLAEVGYRDVVVITGDGYRGLPEQAPFDGILVTAAPDHVPPALLEQLRVGGRLVIPVGRARQFLRLLERTEAGVSERSVFEVRFVPMTGEAQERP